LRAHGRRRDPDRPDDGAAEKALSLEFVALIASEREHQFDTVLGLIDFGEKGDLTVQNPVWYVWRNGTYAPLAQSGGAL
jgi:branched-chain amino acid transport system substrate-binding protein